MREAYTPEINITFAQAREDGREQQTYKKPEPPKKCKGFKKAMEGYIKEPDTDREERVKKIRQNGT